MADREGGGGRRKPIWDEYSGGFVFETKGEILRRVCRSRHQATDTINQGELKRKEHRIKQGENAFCLFEKRHATEMDDVIQTQKSVVAHKVVLAKIAAVNQHDPDWDDSFGIYGGANKSELHTLIECQKTKLTASHRRKKAAEKLLRERKKMDILDRKLDTDTLLAQWKSKRNRTINRNAHLSNSERQAPKLILPPIQVSMREMTSSRELSDQVTPLPSVREYTLPPGEQKTVPVFITERTFYE